MRSSCVAFLSFVLLVGCSARGGDLARRDGGGTDLGAVDGSAHDGGTPTDGGDAGGADAGHADAGGVDAGHDAGGADAGDEDAGSDAGVDAGHDAGTDAGTDAGGDAGRDGGPAADAGPVSNDTCTTGLDVTGGGTFTGTTCGADDTLTLGTDAPSCAVPVTSGTPDVFFLIRVASGGSHYLITMTDGFAMQYVPSVCTGNGGCGPWMSSSGGLVFNIDGGGAGTIWYFALERSDGACGPYSITVTGH